MAAKLLVAVSAVALAASAASAQTSSNTSEVSQTGTNNVLAVENEQAGNDQNRSTALQNGRDNRAAVLQIGDFNISQVRQLSDRNLIVQTSEGDFQRTESFQNGNDNDSAIRQRGQSNSGSVDQRGNRNSSVIAQGVEAGAAANYDSLTAFQAQTAITRAGSDNRAVVLQVGDDLSSVIRQRSAANSSVAANNNSASVQQRGQGNSSTVVQESRGNSATVYQFQGGNAQSLQNVTTIVQANTGATTASNPLSNNRAGVSVSGQTNSGTVNQNGRNNTAELTQGLGQSLVTQITQVGSATGNLGRVAQYGTANSTTLAQNSTNARSDVWQQAGPVSGRSSNNSVEVQQGTGTTGSDAFSSAFFGNAAPVTGAATANLVANVTQGNNPDAASWNVAQVRQDGVDLTAAVTQSGTGISTPPNLARIAQQGGGAGANNATAIQRSGVGPSASGDPASGQAGDELYFAGGARSAEIAILQSGSGNSATVERRGRGQLGRIEQGPGGNNLASILQDVGATNATAIIRQTGSGNTYDVVQTAGGQYILVSQTGNNNVVTNVVQRP